MGKYIDLQDKIEEIERVTSLDELLPVYRPTIAGDSYYFVSYAHHDFKEVYKDILLLQNQGVAIWYDGGMPPGKDWTSIADTMMARYSCKGIIMYLSRNSLTSSSVAKEISFAQKSGKEILPIFVGIKETKELKKIVNNSTLSQEHKETVLSAFHENVIFIPYDETIENKISKITQITGVPLLEYDTDYMITTPLHNRKVCAITNIRDRYIKYLTIPQVAFDEKSTRVKDVLCIGAGSISGCQMLEEVVLPQTVEYVGDYAFANCKQLSFVDLTHVRALGSGCFFGCSSLKEIYFPQLYQGFLGASAFENCINLKRVSFIDKSDEGACMMQYAPFCAFRNCRELEFVECLGWGDVGAYAFENCFALSEIYLGNPQSIGYHSFRNCRSLCNLDLGTELTSIDKGAFEGCEKLQALRLPKLLSEIGEGVFAGCKMLKELQWDISYDSWREIFLNKYKDEKTVLGEIVKGSSIIRIVFTDREICIIT